MDVLRGAVMVLMALDHARDFFCGTNQQPTNLATTTAALFFTRWVTHFCAPVFVFLAGFGARRYGQRHPDLRRFLVTRGLWLIALELGVMSPIIGGGHLVILTVLWVIGWSMIALAALSWLPRPLILAVAVALIAGHNLLDGIHRDAAAWKLLHQQGMIGSHILVGYPLLPWIGVMALGYCLPGSRQAGVAMIVAFVVLRAWNVYGDPAPWAVQPRGALFTVMSFLNTTKYPPSLLYVLMTLGPALVALSLLGDGPRPLAVLGRVPLMFFIVHFAVLRGAAALLGNPTYPLWVAYVAWAAILALLYPLCLWYASVRQTRRWLRYL